MLKALAILIGMVILLLIVVMIYRMPPETHALMIGMLLGPIVSAPMALLLVWALGRRGSQPAPNEPPRLTAERNYPPVIVVGGQAQIPQWMQNSPSLPMPSGPRQYTVVGEMPEEDHGEA